jgi:hypothetical protein
VKKWGGKAYGSLVVRCTKISWKNAFSWLLVIKEFLIAASAFWPFFAQNASWHKCWFHYPDT